MTSKKHKTQPQNDEAEELALIVATAQKHPNSRFCKLVAEEQASGTRANIAALLTELAEHSEFAVDFNISVGYYLDKFRNLIDGDENIFTEASYVLTGGVKLYAKRVDYVNDSAQLQAQSLSKAVEESKEQEKPPPPAKRGRKRALEVTEDRSEVVLAPKKLVKLSVEKRFAMNKNEATSNIIAQRRLDTEQYLHPAGWMAAHIIDFENDEEVDTKRNYKIFTYHLEHRYNTLVPDINFRLHFKMKDFMEEEAENEPMDESDGYCIGSYAQWPEHSEAHVKKYLHLEDRALQKELRQPPQSARTSEQVTETRASSPQHNSTAQSMNLSQLNDSGVGPFELSQQSWSSVNNSSLLECSGVSGNSSQQNDSSLKDVSVALSDLSPHDSGLGTSLTDGSLLSQVDAAPNANLTILEQTGADSTAGSLDATQIDAALGTSSTEVAHSTILDETQPQATEESSNVTKTSGNEAVTPLEGSAELVGENKTPAASSSVEEVTDKPAVITEVDKPIILGDLRIRIPSGDDGISVFFSELDERVQQRIASPTVVAMDVLPNVPNKENLVIRVDAEIMSLCNLEEPETHMLPPPVLPPKPVKIELNILKFNEKVLRRRVLFKLTPDFELFMQARHMKRPALPKVERPERRTMQLFIMSGMESPGGCVTPARSNSSCSEFCGFSECGEDCLGFDEDEKLEKVMRSLSHDCGYGIEVPRVEKSNPRLAANGALEESANVSINEERSLEKRIHAEIIPEKSIAPANTVPAEPSCETNLAVGADIPAVGNAAGPLLSETSKPVEETPSALNASEATPVADVPSIEEPAATETEREEPTTIAPSAVAGNVPLVVTNENNADGGATEDNEDTPGAKESEVQIFDANIISWHNKLAPKLAKAGEQHHFDIFQLGTEIINKFETPRNTVSLEDVMDEKDKKHVSRYFLSSLLLINQNNLRLNLENRTDEQPTAWKDVQFKLLNTKRHTVALEDNIGVVSKLTSKPSVAATEATTVQKRMSCDTEPQAATTSSRAKRPRMASINVTVNVVKPLKPIEKQAANEDEDSGIFSTESVAL